MKKPGISKNEYSHSGSVNLKELVKYSKISIREGCWRIGDVNTLVKIYIKSKRKLIKFSRALEEAKFDKSFPACSNMINELIKAGKADMTIRQYFDAGRPYKKNCSDYGKKIVGKANR